MNAPALPKRYSIASLLGEGGQGRVYRVRDSLRDRDLALKLVSASDSEFLRREFDTLRQIRHENLIQVFDWGTLESREAYYTMELVDGEDWGRRMGAPQSADDVRRILTGILRGLAHLHCHREIHGDLKPGNILLGQGGVVKVSDIGMGASGSEDSRGGIAGTPGYTAPECWKGARANVRSDLYSVGVMAYEALTGKHPFGGRTIREVVAGQMEGWVPSPAAHRVRVPADLERVVMRALEREAPLRQGSADEFMEGFGVEDRVGVILGGKFIDQGVLLPQIAGRVHRKRADDPTLIALTGAPGAGKTEWLEELNQAFVSDGVRCVLLTADERLTFGAALSAEIGPHNGGQVGLPDSPKDLVATIQAAANGQPLAILLDSGDGHFHSYAHEGRSLAQHLFAESAESGEIQQTLVVIAGTAEPTNDVFSVQVPIPELDEVGTTALATGLLGALDLQAEGARALHQAAGGNPASLQAVLFDLVARGELERIEGHWKLAEVGRVGEGTIPSFDQRWLRRWDQLRTEHQEVLGAIALLGAIDSKDSGRLEARIASTGAIAALRAAGWLKLVGHRVRLASGGLGELVAGFLDNDRGRELSQVLLEMQLGAESVSAVMLRLRAQPSSKAVSEAIGLAGSLLEIRAFSQASVVLRECSRHQSLLGDLTGRADLWLKLVEVAIGLGRLDEAEGLLEDDGLMQTAAESAAVRAEAHWYRGILATRAGRTDDARDALESAIAAAREAGDLPTHVKAVVARAELAWMHGNDQECAAAIKTAQRTLSELPRSAEHDDERGQLVYAIGASLIRAGQLDQATTMLDSELPTITSPYWSARVANAKGGAHFYLGQYDRALEFLTLAIERLPDGDAPELRARVHANRGACLNAMGRLRRALDDNERALELSRRSGSGYDIVAAAAGIAIDRYYLGHFDEAIRCAQEVYALASKLNNVIYQFKGLELEGFALEALGDFTGLERILTAADRLPKDHDPPRTLPRIDRLWARFHVAQGRRNEAAVALGRAHELLKNESDLEDLWGVEIEFAVLNQVEAGDLATLRTLSTIASRAREAKNIVVDVDAVAAIAQIVTSSGRCDSELIGVMTSALGRAEESGFVDQAARISVGLGGALIDAGDVRAGQSRLIQAQRLLRQIAGDLSSESREFFVRSPHVASALSEIERRLKPLPR